MSRPSPSPRSVSLVFGPEQYLSLVVTGVFGTIPVSTWLVMVAAGLGLMDEGQHHVGRPPNEVLVGISVALMMAGMLVAPWLVPCLVLRARQPHGARIEWNDEEIVEWDGPYRRVVIPWTELLVRQRTWRVGKAMRDALSLQLSSKKAARGAPVITVWTSRPDDAPKIRRRLVVQQIDVLQKAIEAHGIEVATELDPSLAIDRDRQVDRRSTLLGRFGYPLAVLAPLLAPAATAEWHVPVLPVVLALAAVVLLGVRALPAFREVRAIRARLAESLVDLPAGDAEGRQIAGRSKLRAALAEALIRGSFPVLVVVTTAIASFHFTL